MNKQRIFLIVAIIELSVIVYLIFKLKKTTQTDTGAYGLLKSEIADLEQEVENTKTRYRSIMQYNGLDPDVAEEKFDDMRTVNTGGIAGGLKINTL